MPDWKDAPEWAQWLAQDFDGEWSWFIDRPNPAYINAWVGNIIREKAGHTDYNPAWRDTLQHRP